MLLLLFHMPSKILNPTYGCNSGGGGYGNG